MYFINKSGFIVSAISLDVESLIASSVAVYNDAETLQIDYPKLTDSMVLSIPDISIQRDSQKYVISQLSKEEKITLCEGETIEDWIETQTETISVYLFDN